MEDRNSGLIIEGFVKDSYQRMFDKEIEARNHPLTSWSQATISNNQDNFDATKEHVLRTLDGLQHTLYHAGDNDGLLTELSRFEERAHASQTVIELADAITEARPILDQSFSRPNERAE